MLKVVDEDFDNAVEIEDLWNDESNPWNWNVPNGKMVYFLKRFKPFWTAGPAFEMVNGEFWVLTKDYLFVYTDSKGPQWMLD